MIVDAKPGANGIIASDAVTKAPADGMTLLFSGNSIAINPYLYRRLPFDTRRDLVPAQGAGPDRAGARQRDVRGADAE